MSSFSDTGADDAAVRTRTGAVLLARYAFAAAPSHEMARLTARIASLPAIHRAVFAYAEQGHPTLRDALLDIRDGCDRVLILPLIVPMEPSFRAWMTRTLRRWQQEEPGRWPPVHIGPDVSTADAMTALLHEMVEQATATPPATPPERLLREASLVPAQKRRALVCHGGPCTNAGASVIWGHLRNEQERLALRTTGDGTMTAKSTCLGPCSLAPVMQVFPEGTYYGGLTEAAVERIAREHLLEGYVVEDFAYEPTGKKQRLRPTT